MADESSRLLVNSEHFRTCSIAKNSKGYIPGSEYCAGVPDTISDGDCRGRDPQDDGGSIGTNKDIQMRNCLMTKNADGYTYENQYCAGTPDTIADGDDKGREPKSIGQEAGTCIDFHSRNCLLTKNASLYTKGNEYCAGSGRV